MPVLSNWTAVVFAGGEILLETESAETALGKLETALSIWRSVGGHLTNPYLRSVIARTLNKLGRQNDALTEIATAIREAGSTGEKMHWPELIRVQGEMLLSQSNNSMEEAEECFEKAIEIARTQKAKSWELRAANSLARLWQSQGKRQEAHDRLAPVYEWFTEGLDTADLKDAKALLEALK